MVAAHRVKHARRAWSN